MWLTCFFLSFFFFSLLAVLFVAYIGIGSKRSPLALSSRAGGGVERGEWGGFVYVTEAKSASSARKKKTWCCGIFL